MILQKMRKNAKVVAWLLISAFVLSALFVGVNRLIDFWWGRGSTKDIVMIVESKEYDRREVEKVLQRNLPDSLSIALFLDEAVTREVVKSASRKLHVGISNSEIDLEFNTRLNSKRDKMDKKMRDSELVRLVFKTTPSKLKDQIRDELTAKKLKERLEGIYSPSDNEINTHFNKYKNCKYTGKKLKEVKADIIDKLKQSHKKEFAEKWLEDQRAAIKVEFVDEEYAKGKHSDLLKDKGLAFSNVSFARLVSMYARYPQLFGATATDDTPEVAAMKLVYDRMSTDLIMANEAVKRKLMPDSKNLTNDKNIFELRSLLEKDIEKNIQMDDDDLKLFFSKTKEKYDEKERAYANVVFLAYKTSDEDRVDIEKKADKALDVAIKSNKLKGDIQELSLDQFKQKVSRKTYRKGEVVPTLLKDGSTYIIAKEDKGNIKYVEFAEAPSARTKKEVNKQSTKIIKDLKEKKLDFKKSMEIYSEGKYTKELGPIYRESDEDRDLVNKIFNTEDKKLEVVKGDKGIFILERTQYHPEKKATFENVRGKIESEYKQSKRAEAIENLRKYLNDKSKVKVLDPEIKKLIK